jgi:hypothetical protein
MALEERQIDVFEAFLNRHMNDQVPFGGTFFEDRNMKYVGLPYLEALDIARGISALILFERPRIDYADFEKAMLERIPLVWKLNQPFAKSLHESLAQRSAYANCNFGYLASAFTQTYFEGLSQMRLPFDEALKSYRLCMKVVPLWLRQKPSRMGEYEFSYDLLYHTETPLIMIVRNAKGRAVATVGGYIYIQEGKPSICVTNIQGTKLRVRPNDPDFLKKRKEHAANYANLNENLGENWRVFFAKQVVNLARRKGFGVVGVVPKRFALFDYLSTDKGYKRQVRQSNQTYRKAGLVPHSSSRWRLPK